MIRSTPAPSSSGALFDFYISTSGSDANAGTVAAPWAITSLISNNSNNSKMAGKRVGFLPGTYNVCGTSGVAGATTIGNGSFPSDNDHCALSIPPGSSSASTYIGSSDTNGHYLARTATIFVVSGQVSSSNNQWANALLGCDVISSGNFYVTIDGLIINGNGLDCSGPNGNEGAHLVFFHQNGQGLTTPSNALGVIVQNCEIFSITATDSGGNDTGIWMQGLQGALIQNNYIHDISKSVQPDHCHGIEMYGCQQCTVTQNTFVNCMGCEGKVGNWDITVSQNYFYNCAQGGLGSNGATLQSYDGGTSPTGNSHPFNLHNNIVDSCGRVTYGESYNADHRQALNWYNNTIYASSPVVLQQVSATNLIAYYNNINVLASPSSGFQQFTTSGWSTLDYNCTYVSSGSYTAMWQESGTNYNSLAAWQAAPGSPDAHGLAQDPQFTVGTANIVAGGGPSQFKLAGGSPCVGTGQGSVNMGAWDGTVTQIGCGFGPYA